MSDEAGWTLVLAASAEKSLGRLPEKIAAAVAEFMLSALVQAPYIVGRPLHGELSGLWAARRGAYRILYQLDETTCVVEVVRVDHRADAYRSR